jgi:PAS domain S-box-containing protein
MTITRIADGKFIDANEAFCRMFEFNRAEVIDHTSSELNMWTPEERQRLIQAQLASGGLLDFELQARAKSGRRISILFSSRPLELAGERCHITTMIDISARKSAEEAAQAQCAELRRWQEVMLDREDRVQELKREVNELTRRLGEPVRYPSQETGAKEAL